MSPTKDPTRPIIIVTGANKCVYETLSRRVYYFAQPAPCHQRRRLRNLSPSPPRPCATYPRRCAPCLSKVRECGRRQSIRPRVPLLRSDPHHGVSQPAAGRGRAQGAVQAIRARRGAIEGYSKWRRAHRGFPRQPRRFGSPARPGFCAEHSCVCRRSGAHVSPGLFFSLALLTGGRCDIGIRTCRTSYATLESPRSSRSRGCLSASSFGGIYSSSARSRLCQSRTSMSNA